MTIPNSGLLQEMPRRLSRCSDTGDVQRHGDVVAMVKSIPLLLDTEPLWRGWRQTP